MTYAGTAARTTWLRIVRTHAGSDPLLRSDSTATV